MRDDTGIAEFEAPAEAVSGLARKPVLIIMHGIDSSPGRIGHLLRRKGYRLDCRKPRFGCTLPETLDEHAGVVIFGGPMSANDDEDFIKSEIGWIGVPLKEQKPYLGVCLGAQMLAKHLGARVERHQEEMVEIGYYDVRPTARGALIGDWPRQVYHWHREGFELASGTSLLAEGDAFPHQAYTYGPGAAGVQFHPEITYALVNRWTTDVSHRLGLKNAQSREQHLDGHVVHTRAVGTWLDRFLELWLSRSLPAAG